jgi:hypothetical protein
MKVYLELRPMIEAGFPMDDDPFEVSLAIIVDVARLWARKGRTPTGEVLRYAASGGLAHPHQGFSLVTGRPPGAWGNRKDS